MANILIVDDEVKMRHLLAIMLNAKGHTVEQAADGMAALAMLQESAFDMVITDIKMPRMDGMELLQEIQERKMAVPVVIITAFATVESAVKAMRKGAVDYITKPFEEERILLAVERTLNVSRLMIENVKLKTELDRASGFGDIVCASDAMKRVMEMAAKVAQRDSTVLILGQSGAGKEVVARFIHEQSPRKRARFIPVNCAAISRTLVESELFGHEKGSFTGAEQKSEGKFEYADGGTLFLDEIGDLPFEAQSKLLRTLQDNKIQRVGGNREIQVDVRVICATNQRLPAMVDEGTFRNDLFFRINVFPIEIPPLKARADDIAPLAEHFLRRFAGQGNFTLSDAAVERMMDYPWPGNVRELANAMERAVILCGDGGVISGDDLSFLAAPCRDRSAQTPDDGFKLPEKGVVLESVEDELVRQALRMANNNQTSAAALLGVTRSKFRVLMKRLKK